MAQKVFPLLPWGEGKCHFLPSSRLYSLCCLLMEVAFVHRATPLIGRPAPCTLSTLLRRLGSVLTWTQEQPKGAEMGTGGWRTAGKTPWSSWPCKAVGIYDRASTHLADVFRMLETLSSSAHVPNRNSHGADLFARQALLVFFPHGEKPPLQKKSIFFPLHIVNIVWKADF